jgi:hypothetical protein
VEVLYEEAEIPRTKSLPNAAYNTLLATATTVTLFKKNRQIKKHAKTKLNVKLQKH